MQKTAAATMESIQVARCEYKYHVRACEVPAIRDRLLRYCVPDANSRGGEWYAIRSLYLDTRHYRLYHESKEKLPFRFKLRARAYGDARGSVKFEVKRRVRDLIVKTSATVKAPEWAVAAPAGLPGLFDLGKPAMHEFLQLAETWQASPRMLVYYERQAFSSTVDDYVRVTFDRAMKCQPMRDWCLTGEARSWLSVDAPASYDERDSVYVLEVKFAGKPPGWLRDFSLACGLERRGFSKYCRSVERAVFDREPAFDLTPSFGARLWGAA
jgi:hypothetical protein